jgi:MFS family permease
MSKKSFFTGISRNIILLGFVSLFTDLSSQMVFPLVPLYLTGVLGASAYVVGIVEGAAETTASLLKVVSGYWSDKIHRRKPFVLFGYTFSALSKPLMAFATFWPFVLGVRVLDRIGKGLRDAPRDAIVADEVNQKIRGKAYGFQRSLDGLGSILGAVLAVILLPLLGYTKIFLFAFLPGILAVATILFIKEKRHEAAVSADGQTSEKKMPRVSLKMLPGNLKLFILVSAVFALGNFGYAFMMLKAKALGFSDHNAILLYVLYFGVYTLFTIPAGMLSDKIGRKPLLIIGYVFFILTSIGLIFVNSMLWLIVLFALYGVFFAMTDGNQRAFIVDMCPPNLKATALGTFQTAIGVVALPGGFIAGILWDKMGSSATFIYGGVLTALAIIMLLFVKKQKETPSAYHSEKVRISF